jgi:hypothetical protein
MTGVKRVRLSSAMRRAKGSKLRAGASDASHAELTQATGSKTTVSSSAITGFGVAS